MWGHRDRPRVSWLGPRNVWVPRDHCVRGERGWGFLEVVGTGSIQHGRDHPGSESWGPSVNVELGPALSWDFGALACSLCEVGTSCLEVALTHKPSPPLLAHVSTSTAQRVRLNECSSTCTAQHIQLNVYSSTSTARPLHGCAHKSIGGGRSSLGRSDEMSRFGKRAYTNGWKYIFGNLLKTGTRITSSWLSFVILYILCCG